MASDAPIGIAGFGATLPRTPNQRAILERARKSRWPRYNQLGSIEEIAPRREILFLERFNADKAGH